MKRLLALLLCLSFVLAGCGGEARGETGKGDEPAAGGSPAPDPAAAEGFETLALRLAAYPEVPAAPDEEALWAALEALDYEKLGAEKYDEESQKLWDAYGAQRAAYSEAVQTLRGEGVDASLTSVLLAYTLKTAGSILNDRGLSDHGNKNVVYSPANLYLALCMLAETAGGESRAQLLDLLGLGSVEQARTAANQLWRALWNESVSGKTLLANSVWLNEQVGFHGEVVDTLAEDYYASTFRAAMGNPATDAAIAEWINENTGHLLEDAAASLRTYPETLMMLISTLYFKEQWSDRFEAYNTREDVFTNANGAEERIGFMHRSDDRGAYYRGDGFTAASMGFRNGERMYFLLPDEDVPLDTLLSGENVAGFVSGGQEPSYAEIRWSVPKFDVNSDIDMIPQLKYFGVTDIFSDAADFSPLTELDAAVSAIKHAARVKVDEEGCEAAAFTAIMVDATAMMPDDLPVVEMNLNRPFGFLITGADGLPLFMGVVYTVA